MKTHLYQRDPTITAHHPDRIPCTCGMPKTDRIHTVKPLTAEQKAAEQRRYADKD